MFMDPIPIISTGLNALNQQQINQQNIEYDKQVREEEHLRSLERMAQQQRYALQSFDHEFKTEAEYNNPMAERARLEKAGLNASLMYGSGAGGSSVSASVGSGPSSSLASSPGAIARASDIGSSLVAGVRLENETKVAEAQENKLNAEAEEIRSRIPDSTPVVDGEKPSFAQIQYLLSNNKYVREVYGSEFDKVKLDVAKATAQAEIQTAFATLDSIVSRIENDKNVSSALAEKYRAEVNDMKSTLPSRIRELETSSEANEWKAAHYRALNYWMNDIKPVEKQKMLSEVNNLDSLASLNIENAKYVKAYVILRALDTGSDVLGTLSREARGWATYFIKRTASKKESMLDKLFEVAGDDVKYEDIYEMLKMFGEFAK